MLYRPCNQSNDLNCLKKNEQEGDKQDNFNNNHDKTFLLQNNLNGFHNDINDKIILTPEFDKKSKTAGYPNQALISSSELNNSTNNNKLNKEDNQLSYNQDINSINNYNSYNNNNNINYLISKTIGSNMLNNNITNQGALPSSSLSNKKILYANPAFTRFINESSQTSNNVNSINSKNLPISKAQTTQLSNNNNNFNLSNGIKTQTYLKTSDSFNKGNEVHTKNENNLNNNNTLIQPSLQSLGIKSDREDDYIELSYKIQRNNNNNIDNYNLNNYLKNQPSTPNSLREYSRYFSSNRNQEKKHNPHRSNNTNTNNINSKRNYYSATESFGEESDYPTEFESSNSISNFKQKLNERIYQQHQLLQQQQPNSRLWNHQSNRNSSNSKNADLEDLNTNPNNNARNHKRVSYASITLRQPLKDFNYFSDTEAIHSTSKNNNNNYRAKNIANSISNNQKQANAAYYRNTSNINNIINNINNNNNNNFNCDNSKNSRRSNLQNNSLNNFVTNSRDKFEMVSLAANGNYMENLNSGNNMSNKQHGFSKLGAYMSNNPVITPTTPSSQFSNSLITPVSDNHYNYQQQQQPQFPITKNNFNTNYHTWTPSTQVYRPASSNPINTAPLPPPQTLQQSYNQYDNAGYDNRNRGIL